MSKVNCYFDTKQKSRHRQRRYETLLYYCVLLQEDCSQKVQENQEV